MPLSTKVLACALQPMLFGEQPWSITVSGEIKSQTMESSLQDLQVYMQRLREHMQNHGGTTPRRGLGCSSYGLQQEVVGENYTPATPPSAQLPATKPIAMVNQSKRTREKRGGQNSVLNSGLNRGAVNMDAEEGRIESPVQISKRARPLRKQTRKWVPTQAAQKTLGETPQASQRQKGETSSVSQRALRFEDPQGEEVRPSPPILTQQSNRQQEEAEFSRRVKVDVRRMSQGKEDRLIEDEQDGLLSLLQVWNGAKALAQYSPILRRCPPPLPPPPQKDL